MADTFKGIITADGKKRQLPYGAVLEKPVSDKTLSEEGGFADAKAVGDKFSKVDSETASLKEDLVEISGYPDFKNIEWISGEYVEKNGTFKPYAGWKRTNKLNIKGFDKLFVNLTYTLKQDYNVFYDTEGNASAFILEVGENEVSIPKNAEFVALSCPIGATVMVDVNKESVYKLSQGVNNLLTVKKEFSDLENVLGVTTENVEHHTIKESYSNSLSGEYVWINTRFPIPAKTNSDFTVTGNGDLKVIFFKKNGETFEKLFEKDVDTHTFSIDSFDSDTFFGFYSNNGGINYESGGETEAYTRYLYSDQTISTSGMYNLNFGYKVNFKVKHINISKKGRVIVDVNGNGDYTSVVEAMNAEPEGTVICVNPGIYEQDMTSCLRKRVIVIGTDRNQCVIRCTDGRYGHHPLYVSCGYFENLTIEAPYISGVSNEIGATDLGAYAIHVNTDEDYAVGKQIEFHHCNIISDFFPAIGAGLRKDMTMIIDNCYLKNGQITGRGNYSSSASLETSDTLGALYCHDSNGVQGKQYLIAKDNIFESILGNAMCLYNAKGGNNVVHCTLVENVIKSSKGYTGNVFLRNNPFGSNFIKNICYGNSAEELN